MKKLQQRVNAHINEGYKPVGGIAIGKNGLLLQAVVKSE